MPEIFLRRAKQIRKRSQDCFANKSICTHSCFILVKICQNVVLFLKNRLQFRAMYGKLYAYKNVEVISNMEPLEIILGALILITSILIVVLVLMQEGRQQGLSGAIAGGAETFFGKSKSRTMEQKLVKYTKILAIVFFVMTLGTTLALLFIR